MSDPATHDDYLKRFRESNRISGYYADTTMHMPCGFCAAPDCAIFRVIDSADAMKRGSICKECGRGWRAIFHVDEPGNKQFEIVQTCGDPPPLYLPQIRRVEG